MRSLDELRRVVLAHLDDEHWTTASATADRLGVGHGTGWLRVALTLERLVNDGDAELETTGTARRFRRRGTSDVVTEGRQSPPRPVEKGPRKIRESDG